MKKYALLIGMVCCLVSCSTDEWDNDIQNRDIKSLSKEIKPTSDPDDDWDKGKYSNKPSEEDNN